MNIDNILNLNDLAFSRDVPLKTKTWLKTGGVAAYWIEPDTIEKIVKVATMLDEAGMKYEVIGHTSNIYYVDGYNPDIIISTSKLNRYSINDYCIICECGVPVTKLSRDCAERGIKGFGGMVGLPGTVGAAAVNNSSCFDCSISSLLIEADFYNAKTRQVEKMFYDDFHYARRYSVLKGEKKQKSGILLSVKLQLVPSTKEKELKLVEYVRNYRSSHHEAPALTLGSVFASRKEQKNFRNYIFHTGVFLMRITKTVSLKKIKVWRLWLYGFRDIIPFVSEKNINTFVWLKDEPDKYEKFSRYEDFMNKFYDNPQLEIEVRK